MLLLSIPCPMAWVAARSYSRKPGCGGDVPKTKSLISVVDDDESMREAVRVLMKSLGFTAEAFASAEEFLNSRQLPRTCCLITDVQMPGMTGLELHRHFVALGKSIPTILITAYPHHGGRERALGGGVVCSLRKPFDERDLLAGIHAALSTSPDKPPLLEAKYALDG